MNLKVLLEWFDKTSGYGVGEESSGLFEDPHLILISLELEGDFQIFDGSYDLKNQWINLLQPYFKHQIHQESHDYQISFQHQGPWLY